MIIYFFLGALLGGACSLFLLRSATRRLRVLDEEKQLVSQEKQIVIDFMHEMVAALGEGLTRHELHQRIVHGAILSTGALSACFFERTEDNRMRGAAVEGLFPPHRPLPEGTRVKITTRARFIEQVLKSEEFPVGEGIVGLVAQTGRGVLIPDAASDPRIVRHDDPALAVRSLIAVPVRFRDRLTGVLAVVNPADGLPFSESDFSLVESLAEQSGMAIHHADVLHFQMEKRQLDLDLSVASNIQQMLLPASFPRISGLDIDARYRPAQQIGGDLYDLFPLAGDRICVAVADVSGKGIPASLLMAICRTNLRQIAQQYQSPARVLSALNRAMSGDLTPEMFITIVFACIDLRREEITFSRAGHELPLLLHRDPNTGDAAAEMLGGEGMPLGLVPPDMFDAIIADRTVPFRPGDLFVLYTDGVTEAANEEEKEFSGSRLADLVHSLRNRSSSEVNEAILDSLERFTAGEQRDDITLMTVKRDQAS